MLVAAVFPEVRSLNVIPPYPLIRWSESGIGPYSVGSNISRRLYIYPPVDNISGGGGTGNNSISSACEPSFPDH